MRSPQEFLRSSQEFLPEARAVVLARLWGALCREPLVGVSSRRRVGDETVIGLVDGRRLVGPTAAGELYAPAAAGFAVALGGVRHDSPRRLARALGWTAGLVAELANSVDNLALSRTAAAVPVPVTLADVEARVVDGHPTHPLCRTRMGMSAAEQVAYGPEHAPTVGLDLLRVPGERWRGVGEWPWRDGKDFLLPVHPWQLDHMLVGADVYARGAISARPLLSLRSVVLDDGRHLKTSLSVQMTSAVREVSPAAVTNGPALSQLVATMTGLEILTETASGSALGADGAPSGQAAAIVRTPPALAPGETVAAVTALCAGPDPLVVTYAAGDPVGWVGALADALLPPLLALYTTGVALEAHGQNTLVVLRSGRPVRGCYRDFGGVRVSPALLARHKVTCPPLTGRLVNDDPAVLRVKFLAAIFSLFGEVVAVLARECGVGERALWKPVAEAMAGYPHLVAGPWPVKAVMAMRLAHDQMAYEWAWVPSPVEDV